MADDELMKALQNRGMDEKSARMIIKLLLDANETADLKTRLSEAETLTFAKAALFGEAFRNAGLNKAAVLIDRFNDHFFRKRYSYMGQSRTEFIEGLKPELQHEQAEDRAKAGTPIR